MLTSLYSYTIKIGSESGIVTDQGFGKSLPNLAEMVITSKSYADVQECITAMTTLLATIGTVESNIVKANHIIVTKPNPLHEANHGADDPDTPNWSGLVMLRSFLADAEVLKKKKELRFKIMGEVAINSNLVDMQRSLLPPLAQ